MPEDTQDPDQVDRIVFRQALNDYDDVPLHLRAEGASLSRPLVTIGIPTYRRGDLLLDAVRSALTQNFSQGFEILIVDNDPDSEIHEQLLKRLPDLKAFPHRYYVTSKNIGPFGNWNRCIELARGKWVTILNDDDLLDENFLELMFLEIDKLPSIDGIICNKRVLAHASLPEKATARSQSKSDSIHLGSHRGGLSSIRRRIGDLYWKTRGRFTSELMYMLQKSRHIPASKFFWGTILGNGAGFLFRRDKAVEIGGFYPEQYPSSDFGFFVRFAMKGHLRQHRATAASIRKTEGNITVRTVAQQLRQGSRIQRSLLGTVVPRWYGKLLPMMIAHDRVDYINLWGVEIPQDEIEQAVGMKLPPHDAVLQRRVRFWLRGR